MASKTVEEGLKPYAIGEKLRTLRLRKSMGLVQLGQHTGLSPAMLSKLERGRLFPTLPTLLLGGDPTTAPEETYASWQKALSVEGVYGLMVGRALLYPPDGDVEAAVDTATALVKNGTGTFSSAGGDL